MQPSELDAGLYLFNQFAFSYSERFYAIHAKFCVMGLTERIRSREEKRSEIDLFPEMLDIFLLACTTEQVDSDKVRSFLNHEVQERMNKPGLHGLEVKIKAIAFVQLLMQAISGNFEESTQEREERIALESAGTQKFNVLANTSPFLCDVAAIALERMKVNPNDQDAFFPARKWDFSKHEWIPLEGPLPTDRDEVCEYERARKREKIQAVRDIHMHVISSFAEAVCAEKSDQKALATCIMQKIFKDVYNKPDQKTFVNEKIYIHYIDHSEDKVVDKLRTLFTRLVDLKDRLLFIKALRDELDPETLAVLDGIRATRKV